ncbi:hypothetical protein PAUR_a2048 [Pseudoalteromonas aurantia 208]|uniref:Transposase n=1 Tax=Pseudoalteromonas aurantia 208 TaxID=1314867 RepID=A0ABR9EBT6_9GAMM|nr:hypothetical protein [Pseudoalteromonas aurantia 208]
MYAPQAGNNAYQSLCFHIIVIIVDSISNLLLADTKKPHNAWLF